MDAGYTKDCPFDCKYCYIWHIHTTTAKKRTKRQLKNAQKQKDRGNGINKSWVHNKKHTHTTNMTGYNIFIYILFFFGSPSQQKSYNKNDNKSKFFCKWHLFVFYKKRPKKFHPCVCVSKVFKILSTAWHTQEICILVKKKKLNIFILEWHFLFDFNFYICIKLF